MTEFTKLTPSYQGGEFAKPEHVIEVQEAFAPIESELADHEERVTAAEAVQTSQGRGLVASPPGAIRLLPLPTVMASPPTLTLSASGAASSITNGVTYNATAQVGGVYVPANTERWRLFGGNPIAGGQSGYPSSVVAPNPTAAITSEGFFFLEFMYDGDVIELKFRDPAKFRIAVDGQYVSSDIITQSIAVGDFGVYRYTLDFSGVGGEKARRITVESLYGFHGVTIQRDATIWVPSFPIGPRVIWFGDSYVNSQSNEGPTATWSGFFATASQLLGWRDYRNAGIGGTGFVATNSIAKFEDRVSADIVAHDPDIVIVWGGQNDSAATLPQFQAGVTNTLAAIRAGLPQVAGIVVGPNVPNGQPTATQLQQRDAIHDIAPNHGFIFIDILGGVIPYSGTATDYKNLGWITGGGKTGSVSTGDPGNSNRYIGGASGSDGLHPTQAGHNYYGYRTAAAIAAAMPILGGS
jgi:lysophospholipase L1-like esterase